MNFPERRLLVETLRVLVFLEGYQAALEAKDIKTVIACYSPDYSHYDRGLDWQAERIRERYFTLFEELSVSFRDIRIEFIRKEAGYWMRQEDFDWLRSRETLPPPVGPYLILLDTATGPVEMVLGESPPLSSSVRREGGVLLPSNEDFNAGMEPGAEEVTVCSSVDQGVERSMGEVSFRMLVKGRLAGCCGSEVFTSSLEEKVILLLEKEDGEWKIISQW